MAGAWTPVGISGFSLDPVPSVPSLDPQVAVLTAGGRRPPLAFARSPVGVWWPGAPPGDTVPLLLQRCNK